MICIATIGTSMIGDSFIEVLNDNPRARYIGTFSRDAARAEEFTREHGGERPFRSIEDIASAQDIDAVYLGSPNAIHLEQALVCIAAGKHILVEKPVCATALEARKLFETANAAGVVALEAMRPLHDPALKIIRDALPRLGKIRRATFRFGKYSSRYDELLSCRHTNIFDCNLATGALMDIGVYCVEPLIALFGAPNAIQCAPVLLDESTEALTHGRLDGAGVITASYDHMAATLHYSKITQDLAENQIEGERGTLTFDGISMPSAARIDERVSGYDGVGYSSTATSKHELELPSCANSMAYELEDFLDAIACVQNGSSPSAAPAGWVGTIGDAQEISLRSLVLMDEARRQSGIHFPADHDR